MHRRYSLLGAAALAVTSFAAGAHAQNAPPSGGGAAMLEEVVVTAEKREANLQTVPVAVSAFTSERRDTVGIRTLQDITNFTPGLSYSTGTDRVSLRGIGRLTNNLASEPGVANYLDGIYTVFTADAGLPPLFVDRVEVLRGPQGTLYGRNSIGGAINTITKRPPKTFSGEVRAIYENYDHKELQALVGGPITEGLRFSLGGIKIK